MACFHAAARLLVAAKTPRWFLSYDDDGTWQMILFAHCWLGTCKNACFRQGPVVGNTACSLGETTLRLAGPGPGTGTGTGTTGTHSSRHRTSRSPRAECCQACSLSDTPWRPQRGRCLQSCRSGRWLSHPVVCTWAACVGGRAVSYAGHQKIKQNQNMATTPKWSTTSGHHLRPPPRTCR